MRGSACLHILALPADDQARQALVDSARQKEDPCLTTPCLLRADEGLMLGRSCGACLFCAKQREAMLSMRVTS